MLDVSKNWAARCTLILLKIQSCGARSTRPPGIPWDTWGMLCVMGVGVKFPANGFSTNNATGRQRLRTFDRTIQSCALISKGNLNSCCKYSPGIPRTCTCSVSISKCSVCKGYNDYATWPLQCELAADLQKSRSHCHLPSPHRKALSERFRNCSSKSAAGCLASWNASEN